MDRMTAHCGLICTDCPAFIARRDNDDDLRRKTAAEWSGMYGSDIRPEHIDCDGCATSEGVHIPHCSECAIRICGQGRSVPNCGRCGEYPACTTISEFLAIVPSAREVLDAEKRS